jgi:hypothetical protein
MRTALAYRVALKSVEKIDPSEHMKKTDRSDPQHLIMQRDKVLHEHYEKPKDVEKYEGSPDFEEVSYLVRYLIDENGAKKKKDSY